MLGAVLSHTLRAEFTVRLDPEPEEKSPTELPAFHTEIPNYYATGQIPDGGRGRTGLDDSTGATRSEGLDGWGHGDAHTMHIHEVAHTRGWVQWQGYSIGY